MSVFSRFAKSITNNNSTSPASERDSKNSFKIEVFELFVQGTNFNNLEQPKDTLANCAQRIEHHLTNKMMARHNEYEDVDLLERYYVVPNAIKDLATFVGEQSFSVEEVQQAFIDSGNPPSWLLADHAEYLKLIKHNLHNTDRTIKTEIDEATFRKLMQDIKAEFDNCFTNVEIVLDGKVKGNVNLTHLAPIIHQGVYEIIFTNLFSLARMMYFTRANRSEIVETALIKMFLIHAINNESISEVLSSFEYGVVDYSLAQGKKDIQIANIQSSNPYEFGMMFAKSRNSQELETDLARAVEKYLLAPLADEISLVKNMDTVNIFT